MPLSFLLPKEKNVAAALQPLHGPLPPGDVRRLARHTPTPLSPFFCIVVGAWLERSLVWGRRWLPPSASRKASVRLPRHAHEHMVALSRTSQNPFLTGRVLSWENQNACFGKLWLLFLSRIPEPFTIDELRPPPYRDLFKIICLKICFRVIL